MADKTITDLTAATLMASTDLFEIENAGGNSRKLTGAQMVTFMRGQVGFHARRLYTSINGSSAINVNSTTYTAPAAMEFQVDLDAYPFTHYRIVMFGASNAAGQTVSAQLATLASPTTPIHTGGNDISSIPNTFTNYDSGWLTRDDAATGLKKFAVALKGSNSTVDLFVDYIEVLMKIA